MSLLRVDAAHRGYILPDDAFNFESGDSYQSPWRSAGMFPENAHALSSGAIHTTIAGPSMADEVAFISGVEADGSIAAQSFDTWTGSNHATYSNNAFIGKWGGGTAGTSGGTVTFAFQASSNWTDEEKHVFEQGLTLWSDVANVRFAEASSPTSAEFLFKRGHDSSAYTVTHESPATAAVGSSNIPTFSSGYISIDTGVFGFGPIDANIDRAGGYVWSTIVHEEGHAIGLGHAGPYNGDVNEMTQQYSAYDSLLWSIMSYIDPATKAKYSAEYPVKGTQWHGGVPTTIMPLDILAAQSLYGASTHTALDGGQTFGFNCNVSDITKDFFDFTVNKDPIITLYDQGKHNTLDLSGFHTKSTITLDAGTFSSCDGMTNNIAIAFGTRIDSVVGGTAGDKLTGNHFQNAIDGGNGNDKLGGSGGADSLTGGSGHDTFIFEKASVSTSAKFDTITDFKASDDRLGVPVAIAKVDHAVTGGLLSAANFDADLAKHVNAPALGADHAVLFAASKGDFKGETFLIVDMNGQAGYQAGADLVIHLDGHIGHLTAANFT